MRIAHTISCRTFNAAVHIRRTLPSFCKYFNSFNFLVVEKNFILHIVESVPELIANLFSNTHTVPGLPISKIRPIETYIVLGNLLNLFLLELCKYHNIATHRNCVGPL